MSDDPKSIKITLPRNEAKITSGWGPSASAYFLEGTKGGEIVSFLEEQGHTVEHVDLLAESKTTASVIISSFAFPEKCIAVFTFESVDAALMMKLRYG